MNNKIEEISLKAREKGFTLVKKGVDGAAFRKGSIVVIFSISKELDNKDWLHLSLSRPNKYPAYEEIKHVKDVFIGDEKAIMVFPKSGNHVNIHPYCFHLRHCLSGDALPDFDRGMGTI